MLRHLASALLSLFALAAPALAACEGENLIDALPPDARASLDQAVAAVPYPEGNFWRAAKPGSTVHVIGTIHVPDPRLAPLAARASALLDGAELLILEATTDDQLRMQRKMMEEPEIAFLTEGPTLIDLLGDETWGRIAADLSARGVPPFMAAKFRPWLLTVTLSVPACAFETMAAGEPGLDGQIEAAARARDIPIATLDNIDVLIGMMNAGSLEEQVEMLKIAAFLEGDSEAAMATTLDSYFAGRHRELWEFARIMAVETQGAGADGAFDLFEESLLDDRNRLWEEKLAALLKDTDAVIAVGAAHLSGDTGILRSLERMGYRLTRL